MLPVPALLPSCSPCVHQALEMSCCGEKDVSGRALKGPQMVLKQGCSAVFFFKEEKDICLHLVEANVFCMKSAL